MNESANPCQPQGLRARKREATRQAITAEARHFTAAQGLNGFTIEQVCEEVGVSRRTFFNYFPSKEDAIIGHLLDEFPADATAVFLAGGASGSGVARGPHGLSTTLLRDLYKLTCAMADHMDFSRDQVHELLAAMKKEPQLMMKMMGSAHAREQDFAELIAQREHLPPEDPVVHMAAALFGTCAHRASQAFFSEQNTLPYGDLLTGNLVAAQQLFTFSLLTFEGTA
ncbi:TetR family transcriptional regulator [Arthrobacter sp. LAPM80]|uniref:TetR/AcrR family transcriptional regulator n=1 Tax=Arthrobacter sp. LAPM80 TaxID=3141788 RepID=UPI00398A77E3